MTSTSSSTAKNRSFKIRRQLPYLTRYENVQATNYDELLKVSRSVLGFSENADIRLIDVRRYTELKSNADLLKAGDELGVSLSSEPRVSPAKQKDVIQALNSAFGILHRNSKAGRFGYAEVSLDWRFEAQRIQPLFCCALQLLSYPPYVDCNYPLDWQRIIALKFQDSFDKFFVIHWCHQHIIMCMHPSDLCKTVSKALPISQVSEQHIDLFVETLANLNGAEFWTTICKRSAENHPNGGEQPGNFFSLKMDPDYWPSYKGKADPDSAVCNAIAALIRSGGPPDLPNEWCKAHREIFGIKTACLLNLMHFSCYVNKPLWLRFVHTHCEALGLSIDDLGGACFLTPLAIAAKLGHLECVIECTELGANVDAKTGSVTQKDFGATALFLAAREGRTSTCEFLISVKKANVNALLEDGSSTLAATRNPVIVKLLIEHGANIETLVTKTNNMLWTGYEKDPSVELLKMFLSAGANKIVNRKAGYMDETPLSHICQTYGVRSEQALECAKLLITAGADVNSVNKDGATPLQTLTAATWAPTPGDLTDKFVLLLLESPGINWKHLEGKAHSPLDNSLERGDWRSVAHFVEHGAILTRHQRQDIIKRAEPELAQLIFESQERYKIKEKVMIATMNQDMDKLLRELGEDPRKGSKKSRKTTKGSSNPKREKSKQQQQQQQQKQQQKQKQKEIENEQEIIEEENEEEEEIVEEVNDIFEREGPLTVIASTLGIQQSDSNDGEWFEVGKQKKNSRKQQQRQTQPQKIQSNKPTNQTVSTTTTTTKTTAAAATIVHPTKPISTEEELKRQMKEANEKIQRLENQLKLQEELCSASNAKIQDLSQELDSCNESNNGMRSEIERLKNELVQSNSECSRCKERISQLEHQQATKQNQPQQIQSYGLLDLDRWLTANAPIGRSFLSFVPESQQQPDTSQTQSPQVQRIPSPYHPSGI